MPARQRASRFLRLGTTALLFGSALVGVPASAHSFADLDSSSLLTANTQDDTGHVPYTYRAPGADLTHYREVIVDDVVVYGGSDAEFGSLSTSERQELASDLDTAIRTALQSNYVTATAPSASALRLHVTLLGASSSDPVLGLMSQLQPVGAAAGAHDQARDKKKRTLGSVTYAVEVYDSSTQHLLRSFISYEYPSAEDVRASVGKLNSAKAGIKKGAEALPAQIL
ncbi:MAG TPA: DUF3313 domain-containing protein [Dyella sp.]|uniref:DUF3313 domain-containing protein n=1 Tax=Dyella sp. TaxID=1869338 RepID=UPI002D7914F7|nr:DUF3313 domain-containing protein [Dyella sp.]HET6554210.1 DUF3313 domain-containing protein [Dyella sp.]